MKLLVVTREAGADRRYGLGKSLAPVLEELERRGVEVGYLAQEALGERSRRWQRWLARRLAALGGLFPGTDFTVVAGALVERLNMGRLAAKTAARGGYTHVHCQDPFIAVGYRLFAALRPTLRARWGVAEHGFGSYTQAFPDEGIRLGARVTRWMRGWEARVLRAAHWVLIPTASGRDQLVRDLALGGPPPAFHVVPHPRPALPPVGRSEARRRLGWAEDAFYVLAVGRLVGLKRFERLIEACAPLPVRLVILGEGDQGPLLAAAERYGLGERLEITVTDEVAPYYCAADLYVSTSVTEAFGMANLEALAAGLPSICTAVGGVPEVVGESAWLIGGHACEGLEGALRTLVELTAERERWATRAARRGAAWPDAAVTADGWLAAFQGETPTVPMPGAVGRDLFPAVWHEAVERFAPCPLPRRLEPASSGGRVLVVAPHPDDETIGCGGTVARLASAGCTVRVAMVTDGALGDPEGYGSGDVVADRRAEFLAALGELGAEAAAFLDQPDGGCRHTEEGAEVIDRLLEAEAAEWLLIPSLLDYHRDHVAVALSWLERWHARGMRERLFMYEVWAPLPATWVVDLAPVEGRKQAALGRYVIPLNYYDYADYIGGLNRFRGSALAPRGALGEGLLELPPDRWREVVESMLALRRWQERELA